MMNSSRKSTVRVKMFVGCLLVFLVPAIALLAPASQAADKTYETTFLTIGAGGTSYFVGVGTANLVTQKAPGVHMVFQSVPSMPIILQQMLSKGGFTNGWSETMYDVYNGVGDYKGKAMPGFRYAGFLFEVEHYLIARKDSNIKTYRDLKGKRVGLGTAGSGVAALGKAMVEGHGLTMKDIKPMFLTSEEIISALKDSKIDAGFIAGGYPVPAYSDFSKTSDAVIVPVDPEVARKHIDKYKFDTLKTVKAGAYRGLDQDTSVMAGNLILITTADTPTDLVYEVVKAIWTHPAEMTKVHAALAGLKPENALRGYSFPIHPGAEKYFREAGMMK